MMKLGIDCRDLIAGSLNGIGRFVGNLLRSLTRRESPPDLFLYGNQHTVFDLPAGWGRPVRARHRRAPEAAVWWWDRVTLPRLARRDRLDVFLSPYFKAPGIRSCPVAITIHDLMFLRMPPELSGRSKVYGRAFRTFATYSARRAAVVLTVSEYSCRDIVALLDVPRTKVRIVGNCVGADFRPIDDPDRIAEAKASYGIDGEYLLYVGNFGPHKNVGGLIDAYAGLDGELRDRCSLVLVGRKDRWTPDLLRKAHRLGLENRVLTTGHVRDQHLPALYAGARAFVTLSYWEGFGLPALEAMACGTPVVSSNRAALPEVTGGAALLVDPDHTPSCSQALAHVLSDAGIRGELCEKGRRRAAAFSPGRFSDNVLAALTAAMEAEN
ncbi:MAG: glycosyltransferase family 4 protein [Planctomycetota bacterium]